MMDLYNFIYIPRHESKTNCHLQVKVDDVEEKRLINCPRQITLLDMKLWSISAVCIQILNYYLIAYSQLIGS